VLTLLSDLTPTGAVLLSVGGYGALSVPYFLLVDADLADFDPRPHVRRAIESGRVDPLLVAVANAKYDARAAAARARHIPRDAAITTAALLALLIPTAPEATR
jgi:hypothetical protein